jgi:sulfhydrogenase subunit gamma (sulfur reductase)
MINEYVPETAVILETKQFTPDIKLYRLQLRGRGGFSFTPGQFVEVSLFGHEEAVFGIASSPFEKEYFDICVAKVGGLTEAMDHMQPGGEVGVRGPYGNGFPLDELDGMNVVMAAGGTGITTIASLIDYMSAYRDRYHEINLLYGAREPSGLLFVDRFDGWDKSIKVNLTVEHTDGEWNGHVGLITSLCQDVQFECAATSVVMCGPPVMYRYMVQELEKLGIGKSSIYVSLERRMRCGIGKCQHCALGTYYVCLDGPVFNYQAIADIPEGG